MSTEKPIEFIKEIKSCGNCKNDKGLSYKDNNKIIFCLTCGWSVKILAPNEFHISKIRL